MVTKKIIYLIREDLRISDNAALFNSAKDGQVLIVYVQDINKVKPRGAAYNWWTYNSLVSLNETFQNKYNCNIHFYRGITVDVLAKLCSENQIDQIYLNNAYDPDSRMLEEKIKPISKKFIGNILHQPSEILNNNGDPYKIFTAYWRKSRFIKVRDTVDVPKKIDAIMPINKGLLIDQLNLLPENQWYRKLDRFWQPGENNAKKILDEFINHALLNYKTNRDFPALNNTSKLSPYLAHGEISVVEIWHRIHEHFEEFISESIECFLSELGWRDFSYNLLYHLPHIGHQAIRDEFNKFTWEKNEDHLRKWQKGLTGYPIVDAGMRQLDESGWMHNRVRMIVGSFLTKDLLISWQEGEKWFWDQLVDADYASNPVSWQWVAGSGCDAAPYFRIFNPVTQSQKFDSGGLYIKKWVKELRDVSSSNIHFEQDNKDYPKFIIDHAKARSMALIRYKEII